MERSKTFANAFEELRSASREASSILLVTVRRVLSINTSPLFFFFLNLPQIVPGRGTSNIKFTLCSLICKSGVLPFPKGFAFVNRGQCKQGLQVLRLICIAAQNWFATILASLCNHTKRIESVWDFSEPYNFAFSVVSWRKGVRTLVEPFACSQWGKYRASYRFRSSQSSLREKTSRFVVERTLPTPITLGPVCVL